MSFEDTQATFNSSTHDDLPSEPVLFLTDDVGYNEMLLNENQEESFTSISSKSSSAPSHTPSINNTLAKRRKVTAVHDYIIEQSDGLTLCKICHVRFGKKTATSTMTRHFDAKHHSTYLVMNQRPLDIQRFHPYGHKDQAKVDDINKKFIHWIVTDQISFMLTDSKWFKTFVSVLNERYILPC
ncbi:8072_t:CDS:1 [Ambispora gerdemannii]|uniref:8072_t:CDS:1 n=1 Tax=Ambispora gerdemannii TaxID=144530 RepID=A0A9N9HKD4_9GLOM|nr:8072_t:CDS:1 [Ambispora gerdemannii]